MFYNIVLSLLTAPCCLNVAMVVYIFGELIVDAEDWLSVRLLLIQSKVSGCTHVSFVSVSLSPSKKSWIVSYIIIVNIKGSDRFKLSVT